MTVKQKYFKLANEKDKLILNEFKKYYYSAVTSLGFGLTGYMWTLDMYICMLTGIINKYNLQIEVLTRNEIELKSARMRFDKYFKTAYFNFLNKDRTYNLIVLLNIIIYISELMMFKGFNVDLKIKVNKVTAYKNK